MDAIAESELGRKLARVNAAIEALTGEPPAASPPTKERKKRLPTKGSVRWKAQMLMDRMEGPWTYDQILKYFVDAGDPVQGQDPKAALRTAVHAMVKVGDAIRVEDGIFKSSKFAATPEGDE